MHKSVNRFCREDEGAALIEYDILIALQRVECELGPGGLAGGYFARGQDRDGIGDFRSERPGSGRFPGTLFQKALPLRVGCAV